VETGSGSRNFKEPSGADIDFRSAEKPDVNADDDPLPATTDAR
jgi:hypothetical protein